MSMPPSTRLLSIGWSNLGSLSKCVIGKIFIQLHTVLGIDG
jgi:hypothetical protein